MKSDQTHHPLIMFLSSTRLTIILLILLGIASIAGTVVIQRGTSEESHIQHVYSPGTIRFLDAIGAFDMYHSPLYLGLLIALALNLIVSTLRRLPRDVSLRRRLKSEGKPDPRGIARFGFYVTHAGFLTILTGAMLSGLTGVEGMLWMLPGETAESFTTLRGDTLAIGQTVRCDAFRIDMYENDPGMVREYRTDLTLTDSQGRSAQHVLRVNGPVAAGGFMLYQASYHVAGIEYIEVGVRSKDGTPTSYRVNEGESFEFVPTEGTTVSVTVEQFVSDFQRLDDGRVVSRSDEYANPAALLSIREGSADARKQWVFLNFPNFHGASGPDAAYVFSFDRIQPRFGTGIQISRDPGSTFVWLGSVLLICGLMLSFFMDPSKRFRNPSPA